MSDPRSLLLKMHSASTIKEKITKALNFTLIWKINCLKYFMICYYMPEWNSYLIYILEALFLLSSD